MNPTRVMKEKGSSRGSTMTSPPMSSGSIGVSEMKKSGPRQIGDGVIFSAYYPQAKSVQLAGDFNNWQPSKNPMQNMGDGMWQAKLSLSKGNHRYRLVVDGRWQQDPNNRSTQPNPYGELDSVVTVS
jgi:1,4-alpha-glucan branching enzyme